MNIYFHGSTVQAHVKKSVQYYYYYYFFFPLSLLYASLYESLEVLSVEALLDVIKIMEAFPKEAQAPDRNDM